MPGRRDPDEGRTPRPLACADVVLICRVSPAETITRKRGVSAAGPRAQGTVRSVGAVVSRSG